MQGLKNLLTNILNEKFNLTFTSKFYIMKKIILLIVILFISISKVAFSQEIIFTAKEFYGGFNTSCYNIQDGEIRATVVWEAPPFTYQWNTGSFSNTITNVGAGRTY